MKMKNVFAGIFVSMLMLSAAQADSSPLKSDHSRPGDELAISGHNAVKAVQKQKFTLQYLEQEYIDAINSEVENNTIYDLSPINPRNGRKHLGELNVKEMLLRLKKQDGV